MATKDQKVSWIVSKLSHAAADTAHRRLSVLDDESLDIVIEHLISQRCTSPADVSTGTHGFAYNVIRAAFYERDEEAAVRHISNIVKYADYFNELNVQHDLCMQVISEAEQTHSEDQIRAVFVAVSFAVAHYSRLHRKDIPFDVYDRLLDFALSHPTDLEGIRSAVIDRGPDPQLVEAYMHSHNSLRVGTL